MPGASRSFANPSKTLKILVFPSKILPESWESSKFLPGSPPSAPHLRFEYDANLKTTQNLSKNGPKTGPSPRDAASQNARSARAHSRSFSFTEFRAPQVLRISGSQDLRFSGSQVLRDLGLLSSP